MALLINVLFMSALLVGAHCFDESTPIHDLPPEVIEELLNILMGFLPTNLDCSPPGQLDVALQLYTRTNPTKPVILDPKNPKQINPKKKVILVTHGWLSEPSEGGVVALRNAYLKGYDCNLIIVDWQKMAAKRYTTCVCDIPFIAQFVAEFLCHLSAHFKIPLSSVHFVGHSLGAHLAGFTGKLSKATCKQTLGRVTRLDPAGPVYQFVDQTKRLNKNDATLVDVIHSHELVYGYWGNMGDVDFHTNNCGIVLQPGCPTWDFNSILDVLLSDVSCSHRRSMYYMAESVNNNNFVAKSCTFCPYYCHVDSFLPTFTKMGEYYTKSPSAVYFIPTNNQSLFALGCTPYGEECQ